MGVAALAAQALGIGLNAYGQSEALKAQSGVQNAERGRQQGYNRQSMAQLATLLGGQDPGARAADQSARAAAIAGPQADAARTIASAAGNMSKGGPSETQGGMTAATQAEGQAGVDHASLAGLLASPNQQLQDAQAKQRSVALNRRGISLAAQRSAGVVPMENYAAGFKGQTQRQLGQLLMVLGQAGVSSSLASGSGGGASGAVAPTSGASASIGQQPTYNWAANAPNVA